MLLMYLSSILIYIFNAFAVLPVFTSHITRYNIKYNSHKVENFFHLYQSKSTILLPEIKSSRCEKIVQNGNNQVQMPQNCIKCNHHDGKRLVKLLESEVSLFIY